MNERPNIPVLVRLSLGASALGALSCLPLAVRENPYTFVVFMFLGQPLLALGFVFFAAQVFRDLKSKQLL